MRGRKARLLEASLAAMIGAWIAPSAADGASYVKSVEYVEIVLGAAQTSNFANLTKNQVVTNSVPFASAMATSTADAFGKIFTDVFLTAGSPPTVNVQRNLTGGSVTVGVYVVEFDPNYVKVQQGTFAMTGAQTGPINVAIPSAVADLTRAAVVFYHRNDIPVGAQGYDNVTIEGWFSATNELRFQRAGSGNSINGHWYVFEALNVAGSYAFVVQPRTFSFSTATGTAALTPSVPSEASFIVGSYRAAETQDHPDKGSYRLYLSGCSGSPSMCSSVAAQSQVAPNDGATTVTAFVITFSGGVRVQRGALSYAAAGTQQTATLNPSMSPSSTMVWNALGVGPGAMLLNEGSGDVMFEGHQRLLLASSTTVQGNRGASGATAVGTWEAVEWQVKTNYRSIGTAADYGTGTIDVTAGSVTVSGSLTTWQGANRGRGDVITIPCPDPPACSGGTHYTVLAVDSNTSLRLTEAYAGGSASGLSYLIRRQFSTLAAWEDCIDGPPGTACTYFPVASDSLVADERSEVGIAYEDSVFTAGVVIDGRPDNQNTDATHTITLTADGVNRSYGRPGQGVVIDNSSVSPAVEVMDNYVTIEWLEIRGGAAASADGIRVSGLSAASQLTLRNNLIHVSGDGIEISDDDSRIDVYNNILYNNGQRGIRVAPGVLIAGSSYRILNNTIYNNTQEGVFKTNGVSLAATLLLRNNVSHSNAGDYGADPADSLDPASSHNLAGDGSATGHSPAGNGLDSVLLPALAFVSTAPGAEDLHIQSGSAAENNAADLSSIFAFDIDGGGRQTPWDRGADDVVSTTAVELSSFTATGSDGAVELEWETASELRNMGFHLYRALSDSGPYDRITLRPIPGLGSSPHGARYRYLDTGLSNGKQYFYELEDIETTGVTKRHGPVSGIPEPVSSKHDADSSEPPSAVRITYGDPSASSLRVSKRGPSELVLELSTEGFVAEPQEDGSLQLRVPELEPLTIGPAIPVKRVWVEAVAGRRVDLVSVEARELTTFTGLRLADADAAEIVGTRQGTVRVARSRRRARASLSRDDLYPPSAARVLSVGFQGDVKKAHVELAPIRWDPARGELLLARRLLVRLSFREREPSEHAIDGTRGRSRAKVRTPTAELLARLGTTEPGLYAVAFEEVSRRRSRAIATSALRLSRQGDAVAYHVEPRASTFGPGSTLYFVSEGGRANPYGNEAVFELELATGGLRMEETQADPSGEPVPYYWHVLRREENRYYQAALPNAPDVWLWELIFAPETKRLGFVVDALSGTSQPSRLSVWLQGASDLPVSPDHHVRLYLNGTFLEELRWDGKQARRIDAEVPVGLLREGENTIEIENAGDTGAAYSMVMLDRFEVVFPRLTVAEGGRLEGVWSGSGVAELSGLDSTSLLLLDTTGAHPRWVRGAEEGGNGLVRVPAEEGRRFLAVAREAVLGPRPVELRPTGLRSRNHGADYLLIAPEEFLPVAVPLLELRRTSGLRVEAVAMESIGAEFGFGETTPEALKDFLTFAYHNWQAPALRYAVLLGDATYDFKDYLGTGVMNRVPPRIVETSYLLTASDPSYAAVNGDDVLPDFAIGRVPAATLGEARTMVEKIVAYETGDARRLDFAPVVLVADDPDAAGDFVADANEIVARLPENLPVRRIYLSELGADATRESILRAFDDGALLLSYLGHGGIHVWASENVFRAEDTHALTPQAQQPLLLTMNCLNGFFHFPYFNSLAEELLKAGDNGAIAAFSPSGLSVNGPAHRYHVALLDEMLSGRHHRLGDAVLAAQESYVRSGLLPELLSIYHLLGDPAMTLRSTRR